MAHAWQLSRESATEMDILASVTDALDAIERPESVKKADLSDRITRASAVVQRLQIAASAQTSRKVTADLFMLKLAESLEKSSKISPSELEEKLQVSSEELKKNSAKVSTDTVNILNQILDTVMIMAARSNDLRSTSLP